MAEVVGLAASIIQIAGVGVKLSTTLYNFIGSAVRADHELSDIAGDVEITANALDSVGRVFEDEDSKSIVSRKAIQDAGKLIKRCESVFTDIDGLTEKRRKAGKDGKKVLSTFGRLGFPLKEQRIQLLRTRLESLKNSLILLLNVLQLANAQAKGKLEKSRLGEEREKIRLLHQRQQDSMKSLAALESRLGKVSIDDDDNDDETLQGSSLSSRPSTLKSQRSSDGVAVQTIAATNVQASAQLSEEDSALSGDSEDSEATDDEHVTLEELTKCASHVTKLLKRISVLQQSFESSSQTRHRLPRKRVRKLYRRFCHKIETDVLLKLDPPISTTCPLVPGEQYRNPQVSQKEMYGLPHGLPTMSSIGHNNYSEMHRYQSMGLSSHDPSSTPLGVSTSGQPSMPPHLQPSHYQYYAPMLTLQQLQMLRQNQLLQAQQQNPGLKARLEAIVQAQERQGVAAARMDAPSPDMTIIQPPNRGMKMHQSQSPRPAMNQSHPGLPPPSFKNDFSGAFSDDQRGYPHGRMREKSEPWQIVMPEQQGQRMRQQQAQQQQPLQQQLQLQQQHQLLQGQQQQQYIQRGTPQGSTFNNVPLEAMDFTFDVGTGDTTSQDVLNNFDFGSLFKDGEATVDFPEFEEFQLHQIMSSPKVGHSTRAVDEQDETKDASTAVPSDTAVASKQVEPSSDPRPPSASNQSALSGPWSQGAGKNAIKRSRSKSDLGKSFGLAELMTQHGGPPMPMLASPLGDSEATGPSPLSNSGPEDEDYDAEDHLHDPEPAPTQMPAIVIPQAACISCRIRHLKCDGSMPCSRCKEEGKIGCTYTTSRRGWKGMRKTNIVGTSHPSPLIPLLGEGAVQQTQMEDTALGQMQQHSISLEEIIRQMPPPLVLSPEQMREVQQRAAIAVPPPMPRIETSEDPPLSGRPNKRKAAESVRDPREPLRPSKSIKGEASTVLAGGASHLEGNNGPQEDDRTSESFIEGHKKSRIVTPATDVRMSGVPAPGSQRLAVPSPVYSPSSPAYSPTRPLFGPTSPAFSPTSPAYSPVSPSFSPTSLAFSPIGSAYSPQSPGHSPGDIASAYSPTRPVYSPKTPSHSPPGYSVGNSPVDAEVSDAVPSRIKAMAVEEQTSTSKLDNLPAQGTATTGTGEGSENTSDFSPPASDNGWEVLFRPQVQPPPPAMSRPLAFIPGQTTHMRRNLFSPYRNPGGVFPHKHGPVLHPPVSARPPFDLGVSRGTPRPILSLSDYVKRVRQAKERGRPGEESEIAVSGTRKEEAEERSRVKRRRLATGWDCDSEEEASPSLEERKAMKDSHSKRVRFKRADTEQSGYDEAAERLSPPRNAGSRTLRLESIASSGAEQDVSRKEKKKGKPKAQETEMDIVDMLLADWTTIAVPAI